MANEDEARDSSEKGRIDDLGHVDMGHVDMGHVDMGHVDMGQRGEKERCSRPASAGEGRVFLGGSSRESGVVVRATVESYGPVGETELQVNIKWPAGCNSAPIVEPVKRTLKPPGGCANVG
jgi:hypothetical protein